MHELGIAQNIVGIVRTELERHGGGVVRQVRIRVGEVSGVEVDSLRFCYQVSVEGTALAGSELEVEEVPMRFLCEGCGHSFRPEGLNRTCPLCGGERASIDAGTELEIIDFEVE